jgi:hypothetical protein
MASLEAQEPADQSSMVLMALADRLYIQVNMLFWPFHCQFGHSLEMNGLAFIEFH